MPALHATVLLLPLAAAAVLLRGTRAGGLALLGTVAYLLPLAVLRLDGWTAAPFLGPPIPQAATPFLVTTGGLVVAAAVAWGMAVLTGFRGIHATPGPMPVPAMTSAVLALLGFVPAWPVLAAAGPARAGAAGAGFVAAILLAARAARGLRLRALLSRIPCTFGPDLDVTGPAAFAPWGLGLLLLAVGPHLHVVFAGTVLLLAMVARHDLGARSVRAAVPDAVAALALLAAWWLLGAVAGLEGGWMRDIAQVPLSPAAEYLLVPLLGVVVFRFAGVPPLDGTLGAGTAAIAVLLAWRVVLPLLPGALPAWSAGVLAAAALGAILAGASRRGDLLLAAVGGAALLAGGETGRLGAPVLLVAAVAARPGFRLAGIPLGLRVAHAVLIGWAAGEALTATLSAEVVYSVALVMGAMAWAWPARG